MTAGPRYTPLEMLERLVAFKPQLRKWQFNPSCLDMMWIDIDDDKERIGEVISCFAIAK